MRVRVTRQLPSFSGQEGDPVPALPAIPPFDFSKNGFRYAGTGSPSRPDNYWGFWVGNN